MVYQKGSKVNLIMRFNVMNDHEWKVVTLYDVDHTSLFQCLLNDHKGQLVQKRELILNQIE